MSKQLSLSAAFAVFAMAAFAVSTRPAPEGFSETGAPTIVHAPELQVSLKGY